MWMLDKLEILNFGGLKGGFDIEFKEGLTYIRGVNEWEHGDNNASCKTTLLNAVCWVLYGRTPEGASKYEVINRECKNCRGVLDIGPLSITRTMSRSGERLEFTHMGLLHSSVAPSTKDYRITQVQKELEEYLGIDYHGFCNALFIGSTSKTTKLLESTPAKRAALIESLIDAKVLQVAAKLLKTDAKDLEGQWDDLKRQVGFREEAVAQAEEDVKDLERSISELEIGSLRRKTFVKKETRRIKREFEVAKEQLNKSTCQDMEVLATERNSLKQHIEHLSKKLYGDKTELKKVKVFKPGAKCPTCQQVVDKSHVKTLISRVEELEANCENLSIDLANAKLELEEVEKMMEETREEHRSKVTAQAKIDSLKMEMQLLKDQAHAPETRHLRSMLNEKKDYLEQGYLTIKDMKSKMNKLETRIQYMEKVHYFFSRKIRDFMFDSVREKMNIYANEYLQEFAGERYHLSFPLSEKDKFEIVVYKFGVEAPLATLSGGEKWRIKFALSMAFRSILMENVRTKFGFLLLDDEMGEVDEKGAEQFHKMLKNHRDHLLPQVLLTVPRDIYIKNPDNILTITNGLGTVEVTYA